MILEYKCQFCNTKFKQRCGLAIHVKTCKLNPNPILAKRKQFIKNIDNSDRWICSVCDEHFRVRKDLDDHKKLHLKDVTKSICQYCKQEFFKRSLGAHIINCSLNPNLNKIRENQKKNNGQRGKHWSEEEKKKISEIRKAYLKEHPDKVPYVLNHHRKGDSYPERYFKDAFNNANLQYEFNYKCLRIFS